jgi:hypothetical protein
MTTPEKLMSNVTNLNNLYVRLIVFLGIFALFLCWDIMAQWNQPSQWQDGIPKRGHIEAVAPYTHHGLVDRRNRF